MEKFHYGLIQNQQVLKACDTGDFSFGLEFRSASTSYVIVKQ